MTITFNADKYLELLSQYHPQLIETEAEKEKVLAIVEQLRNCPHRSPQEDELFELLNILIAKFERE